MVIDGVAASQGIDKSAERLIVENCDLSSVEAGEAVWIWEHKDNDQSTPLDVIGIVRFAKKIYSEDDCATSRERYWWGLVRQPLIYVIIRLYDGAGHPGALAVAAQIRDHYANGEKIVVRHSIHGSTLDRNGSELTSTVFRKLASTLTPCNASCDTGLLDDPTLKAMGFSLEKREGVVSTCSMVLECLSGGGPLLADPAKTAPEDAASRIAVVREVWRQGVSKSEPRFGQSFRALAKYHRHDARLATGRAAHDPLRASDWHAQAWTIASRDPRVVALHDRAVEGWRRARERLLSGDTIRAEVEHAALVAGVGRERAFDPVSDLWLSAAHEAVIRRRGDGAGLLGELELIDDLRGCSFLAHLGHAEFVPPDRALAQHRFGCDELTAHAALAEGDEWSRAWDHGDCCGFGAALPAAWLHWLAAPLYARRAGLPAISGDRTGLWDATMPANGGPWPASQTADLERSWSRRFGSLGASLLHFAATSTSGA